MVCFTRSGPIERTIDLAAVLLFQAQGFFERVTVGLVHFETDVGFLDPVSGDGEWGVLCGNLLDADDDVQGVPLTLIG